MGDAETQVAIVGGGPAGLMAGLTLAKLKVDSVVLEKSNYIGHPVHTSGGSWIEDLSNLGIPSNMYNPIKNAIFLSNNSRAEFYMDVAKACVIKVRDMLQYLALKAASSGAKILVGSNVKSITTSENRSIVRYLRNGEENTLKADYAIDSSGFSSIANRSQAVNPNWKNFGYGVEYECWVENLQQDTVYLMVGSKYSRAGYAWIFPVDSHRARIGSGFLKAGANENPQKMVESIIYNNPMISREFGRVVPIEIHSGVVPADGIVENSVIGHTLLAGDSAGQVTPHIGEGIRFALKFGKLAAETVNEALADKGNEADILKNYDKEWKSEIGSPFKRALSLQERIFEFEDTQWDKAVKALQQLTNKQFVSFLRGDFSAKYLFSLLLTHPSLIGKLMG